MKLRVAIVEAQSLFAPFLYDLFAGESFDVVYTSEAIDERELGAADPEIVLIDVDFGVVEVTSALRRLRSILPDATVCAYTARVEPSWAASCVRAGANCVVSKVATPSCMIDGILRAVRIGSFIDDAFESAAST